MIVDAHAHCGMLDPFPPQGFDDYLAAVKGSPIEGAVMFSPVMEIYDRDDFNFTDDAHWRERRRRSNQYLLTLGKPEFRVFPYFFVWNDFAVDQLSDRHFGIKWHRHADEPEYRYDDPACIRAIDVIGRRQLPVVLEEELGNTVRFIKELARDVTVVIPHLGFLNGGYGAIAREGLWELPRVYTDTSLASPREIMDYIGRYGHDRIMFGSDFPFGDPRSELAKIMSLDIAEDMRAAIAGGTLLKLIGED